MMYAFILGHNPKLSAAEIIAVLPQAKKVLETNSFLILDNEEFDCKKMMERLGGTVKIGQIISDRVKKEIIVEDLLKNKQDNKLNFGISFYESKPWKLGMEVKAELKNAGVSCRLVVSREKTLSSVVVTKNKVQEFMIFANKYLAKTAAVQEFEEYGLRDYGRPGRDLVSGMMPPKLAKIMINLSQVPVGAKILDPFCGSGTVLQEALLMGFDDIIACDISEKAIKDTKENLAWLKNNTQLEISEKKLEALKIFQADVRQLVGMVKQVDAIVTEPFLGPPLRGHEKLFEIRRNIDQLSELYIQAFSEFKKILNSNGKVVIIFPAFRFGQEILELPILEQVKKMGFIQLNRDKLIYSRESQKVWRQIYIFQI